MQDSQKFCEMMNGYDWSTGVSEDILRTVISFFAPGEEFPVSEREEGSVKILGKVQGRVHTPFFIRISFIRIARLKLV